MKNENLRQTTKKIPDSSWSDESLSVAFFCIEFALSFLVICSFVYVVHGRSLVQATRSVFYCFLQWLIAFCFVLWCVDGDLDRY